MKRHAAAAAEVPAAAPAEKRSMLLFGCCTVSIFSFNDLIDDTIPEFNE